jgi:aminopeptidase N
MKSSASDGPQNANFSPSSRNLHVARLLNLGFGECRSDTGYYRVGYQPDAVRALAHDAESKLSPAERIALQTDIWASVRVGREPVGDYLALVQGLAADRNRAVLEDVLGSSTTSASTW